MSKSPYLTILAALGLATGILASARGGHVNTNPQHYLERSRELIRAERFAEALAELTLATDLDPRFSDAFAARAAIHLQQGRRPEALADVSEALRVDRRCAEAYLVRAELYRLANNTTLALADLNRAVEAAPRHPRVFLARGQLQFQRQQYADAVSDFTVHLSRINPRDAAAYVQRGQAFLKAGENYEAALADLNKALEIEPGNVNALVGRAEAHERRGKLPEALADYNRALELKPGDPAIHLKRAAFHSAQRRWKECIRDVDIALAADQKNLDARLLRALACLQANRSRDAAADYEAVLTANPNNRSAIAGKASACERLGEWEEAAKLYGKLIEMQPRDPQSLLRRGDCLRKLGKVEEALESINRAIVLNPSYTSAYTHRASLYLSQGKLEEARADYERVVSLYTGGRAPDTTLAYSRVLAHVFAGKWDEGVKHAEEMIRQHPDDGDWLYDMACAYSIAAEVASIDKRLDAPTRQEKSKVLARRAFEVLEKAIAAGYEDFEHMRKDPDFNFINQDPRFKKLGVVE